MTKIALKKIVYIVSFEWNAHTELMNRHEIVTEKRQIENTKNKTILKQPLVMFDKNRREFVFCAEFMRLKFILVDEHRNIYF